MERSTVARAPRRTHGEAKGWSREAATREGRTATATAQGGDKGGIGYPHTGVWACQTEAATTGPPGRRARAERGRARARARARGCVCVCVCV